MILNTLSNVPGSSKQICVQQMPIKMQPSWQQHKLHPSDDDGNGDCPVTRQVLVHVTKHVNVSRDRNYKLMSRHLVM